MTHPEPRSSSGHDGKLDAIAPLLPERYHPQKILGKLPGRRTLLARDQQQQKRVVIKLLSFGEDLSWDDVKLFEREAETLKLLDHPAIPRYLDFFEYQTESQTGFALVQSYIDAQSLEAHLSNGRSFREIELRQLAKQLLTILAELHQRHPPLIHRDIKPSNILLGDRTAHSVGQVHLIDFGSVQTLANREGGTMTVVGTYGYMPPEQFGGKAVAASDLYSLGATLVYLATGQHPAELPQVNLRIQFEPQAQQLSEGFMAWLRRMIEPSLSQRFESAAAALTELEQTPISAFQLPVQSRSLPAPPQETLIKAQWKEDCLEIAMTRDRLSVHAERRAVSNPVLRWLNRRQALGYVGCLAFFPGMGFLFGILFIVVTSNLQGLALWVFNGLVLGGGAIASWRFVQKWLKASLPTLIRIDEKHLTIISEGHQVEHQFERRQIWRLWVKHPRDCSEIRLYIGAQTLRIRTHSAAEWDWLKRVLSQNLELPVES